ncbi:MAG: 4Fe-4S dicluster domain-containing protein [Ignavibacteriaceae bacterium]|nr:4Fe-4S dicluster domain-containing protein [Ignavibacteriaceae bacterium]
MSLPDKIFSAGVVGAGGAGFPAHIKSVSNPEILIVNGAECEPLIHKDYELMVNYPEEIVNGIKLLLNQTGASKSYFGIKSKNKEAIKNISSAITDKRISILELGDFYPSGDEYELVYEATGKLIPPAGIPLEVGCLVNNVETLFNIFQANTNIPVTEKFVCVTGAVNNPCSFFVPVGTSFKDLISIAGGSKFEKCHIFIGGIMMGTLTANINEVVTKTTAGIIVLPENHYLVKRKSQPEESWHRIGKSACDQCSYCTEFCPRYLLGYQVEPHKVMRSLGFTKTGSEIWNQMAELCCSCGLCTLYSCPEDLYPNEACTKAKREMNIAGIKFTQRKPVKVHPLKNGRKVPLNQLIKRLCLQDYDRETPFKKNTFKPSSVILYLKQHIGSPSIPVVEKNQEVKKGEMIAKVPRGKLGANIHASIEGYVSEINESFIRIKSN